MTRYGKSRYRERKHPSYKQRLVPQKYVADVDDKQVAPQSIMYTIR